MYKFYVTRKEIEIGLGVNEYRARNVFKEVRKLAVETDTPLIDRTTVPTKLLCKYLKISPNDFLENIKKALPE